MYITQINNHIALEYNEALDNLIPHARSFDYRGAKMLLIPATSTRRRNLRAIWAYKSHRRYSHATTGAAWHRGTCRRPPPRY